MLCIKQYRCDVCIKNKIESLMMALTEHCPSTWHMLIERLISLKLLYNIKLSSSGVQVSKR